MHFHIPKRIARELSVILGYSFIWIVFTFPLITRIGSSIIGTADSDAPIFLWNAWEWIKYPFVYTTTDILVPGTHSLLMHTYTPVFSTCVGVFNFFLHNLVLSFNLNFFVWSVLSAYATYRLVRLFTPYTLVAFFGGLFFAFQPLWSVYVSFGTQNILSQWFLPASVLFCVLALRTAHYRYTVLSGTVIALAWYNDLYAGAFALSSVLFACALHYRLHTPLKKIARILGSTLMTFVICFSPFLFTVASNHTLLTQSTLPSVADVDVYGADPVNLLRPYERSITMSSWSHAFTDQSLTRGNAFLGMTMVCIFALWLGVNVLTKKRTSTHLGKTLFCIAAIYFVLSLGPSLTFFGVHTHIPLPYRLFYALTPLTHLWRVPLRWLIPTFFWLALFLSLILTQIYTSLRKTAAVIVVCSLIVLFTIEHAYIPRPLIDLSTQTTQVYTHLRSLPSGTLLELPLSIDSGLFSLGDAQQHLALALQTIHEHPVINGHLSRLPESVRSLSNAPVFSYLLHCVTTLPTSEDTDTSHVESFIATTHLRYITIDRALFNGDALHTQALLSYLADTLHAHEIQSDSTATLFQIDTRL